MSYLLLLVIFWKPIYHLSMYIYKRIRNKDNCKKHFDLFIFWWADLAVLVWPKEGEEYATKKEHQ